MCADAGGNTEMGGGGGGEGGVTTRTRPRGERRGGMTRGGARNRGGSRSGSRNGGTERGGRNSGGGRTEKRKGQEKETDKRKEKGGRMEKGKETEKNGRMGKHGKGEKEVGTSSSVTMEKENEKRGGRRGNSKGHNKGGDKSKGKGHGKEKEKEKEGCKKTKSPGGSPPPSPTGGRTDSPAGTPPRPPTPPTPTGGNTDSPAGTPPTPPSPPTPPTPTGGNTDSPSGTPPTPPTPPTPTGGETTEPCVGGGEPVAVEVVSPEGTVDSFGAGEPVVQGMHPHGEPSTTLANFPPAFVQANMEAFFPVDIAGVIGADNVLRVACPFNCEEKPCEVFVTTYHCPPCSTATNGGLVSLLPDAGWEAGSCAPTFQHVGAEGASGGEHPTVAFRKLVSAGSVEELPALTAPLANVAVFVRQGATECGFADETACTAMPECAWEAGASEGAAGMCVSSWCPADFAPPATAPCTTFCVVPTGGEGEGGEGGNAGNVGGLGLGPF